MDQRLNALYTIPQSILPQEIHLEDLSQQCAEIEQQLRDRISSFPAETQALLDLYISLRDELEFQTAKQAMRYGKHLLR